MQKHVTATHSAQNNVRCSTIRILEDSHDEKEDGSVRTKHKNIM